MALLFYALNVIDIRKDIKMKLFHVIICTICFFLATLYFITSFLIWDPVHISIGLLLIFGTAWATAREIAKP